MRLKGNVGVGPDADEEVALVVDGEAAAADELDPSSSSSLSSSVSV